MAKLTDTAILIADSSGLVSLFAPDRNHDLAVSAAKRFSHTFGSFIIPGDVFSETINTLWKRYGYPMAHEAAGYLTSTHPFLLAETDAELRTAALARFGTHSSGLSYTDCIVLAFADYYNSRQIFGFDEGFQKQGYDIIGKEIHRSAA